MKVSVEKATLLQAKTQVIVAGIFDDLALGKELEEIDRELNHAISKKIKAKNFSEALSIISVSTNGKFHFDQVMVVGLGKKSEADLELLRNASALTGKIVRDNDWKNYSTNLHLINAEHLSDFDKTQAVAEGIFLGLHQFSQYKTTDLNKIKKLEHIVLLAQEKHLHEIQSALHKAETICSYVNWAKDLSNTPSNNKTPNIIAKSVQKLCRKNRIRIKV